MAMHQRSSLGVEAYAISTLNDSFASGRVYDEILLGMLDEVKQKSSDTFKRKHKQLAEQITQARHLPFMTDDLIHTLLDLLGIVSADSLKSRAVFQPSYNAKRPRIYNGQDYDKTLRPIK